MESKDDNKENTPPLDLIEMNDELRTQPEDSPPLIDDRPMHMDPEPEEDKVFHLLPESRWEQTVNFKRMRERDEREEGVSFKAAKVLTALDDMKLTLRETEPDHRDVTPCDM